MLSLYQFTYIFCSVNNAIKIFIFKISIKKLIETFIVPFSHSSASIRAQIYRINFVTGFDKKKKRRS